MHEGDLTEIGREGHSEGTRELGDGLLRRLGAGDGGQRHVVSGQARGQAGDPPECLVHDRDGVEHDVAVRGAEHLGVLTVQHRHHLLVGGGEHVGPELLEAFRREHLGQLSAHRLLADLGDGPGGEPDFGRQRMLDAVLDVQGGEELRRGSVGHRLIHARLTKDGADGAHEDGGVEHGPVGPHHRHRQDDEQAAHHHQEPDESTAESTLGRCLHRLQLVPERVAFGSEPAQLLVAPRFLVAGGHRRPPIFLGRIGAHHMVPVRRFTE